MEVAKPRSEKSAESADYPPGRRRFSISIAIVKPSNLPGNTLDLSSLHSLSN
jgi:hypothetical protein